jgi:hypothetical protein
LAPIASDSTPTKAVAMVRERRETASFLKFITSFLSSSKAREI